MLFSIKCTVIVRVIKAVYNLNVITFLHKSLMYDFVSCYINCFFDMDYRLQDIVK